MAECAAQTSPAKTPALTNKDVLDMLAAGLSEAVVIAKIGSSACDFDTSPAVLKDLKAARVPDSVILAMIKAPASHHDVSLEALAQPSVDEVLARYVSAIGGRPALERHTSVVRQGTIEYQGKIGSVVSYGKAPNKAGSLTDFGGAEVFKDGFDGTVGWVQTALNGVREKTGTELEVTRELAEFNGVLRLHSLYPDMALKGVESVGDRKAYVIESTSGNGAIRHMWFFDTDTGLLVRSDLQYDGPKGRVSVTWYQEDYREVDGVKQPFAIRQVNGGATFTTRVSQVRYNEAIDDAKFADPSLATQAASTIPSGTVRALAYRVIPQAQTTYYQTGQASSYTSCYGQGQWASYGSFGNLNMTTDCNTTYTNPTQIPITWRYADVYNVVETDTQRYVIGCRANWRWSNCSPLVPGDTFSMELEGSTMHVTALKNGKKQVTIKYTVFQVAAK
jgi:hypothetical protein